MMSKINRIMTIDKTRLEMRLGELTAAKMKLIITSLHSQFSADNTIDANLSFCCLHSNISVYIRGYTDHKFARIALKGERLRNIFIIRFHI